MTKSGEKDPDARGSSGRDSTCNDSSLEEKKALPRTQSQSDDQTATLLTHCALEALWDSPLITSLTLPLHPKTSVGALTALEKWITEPRSTGSEHPLTASKPLLWFSGPLGSGKTTILRELAKRSSNENRLLASFFFSTHSIPGVNTDKYFVPTVAYQIASNIPGLWDFVSSAIQEDPEMFARPLDEQMLGLIFEPLERYSRYSTRHRYWWRRLKASVTSRGRWPEKLEQCTTFRKLCGEWWNRNIIIVDGLDECVGIEAQRHVIALMTWAGERRKFPLRFVASGPVENRNIVEAFHNAGRESEVFLSMASNSYKREAEMKAFVQDELDRIKRDHPMAGSISWPEGWPGEVGELLVKKASGLFVYLSTVIAFIDDPKGNPVELLEWLSSSIPSQNTADYTKPFAELDELYTAILHYQQGSAHNVHNILELRKRVLHAMIFSGMEFGSVGELDEYLGVEPGSVESAVRHLHSLICFPHPPPPCSLPIVPASNPSNAYASDPATGPGKIWFRHKSLWDFLVLKERSGDMHQCIPVEKMTFPSFADTTTSISLTENMAFTNASHFTIAEAQFNAITNQNQSLAFDKEPLSVLLNHSAINAMADSPSASYAPTCHPGTRENVTGDIMAWARDPTATALLWLSGPAGAGKSCIQRKIVQLCADEGFHVACFFFSIREPETSNEARFITTLAAQLAENIPGLKWYIERAIKMDHRMFTRSLDSQVEGLIFKPLQELEGSMSNRLKGSFRKTLTVFGAYRDDPIKSWMKTNVIVVDGLDECVNEKEQVHILHLIHSLATHSHFPFRFVIASRPEYAIRTAFSSTPMSNDTLILRLENYRADEDIRRFLRAEFSRLKSDHPASASIPAEWPSAEDENALVTKASKQFVYVSVVMKHLTNPRLLNPMLELQHILGHRPSESDAKTNPFAELDALYNRDRVSGTVMWILTLFSI
ncbi:hypothetical protein EST38_g8844 [Candolleomyces aberdarensis]|uniref:Nephrocystin 3-like N-terminal domain-containing protein n=1 Tax=Candolleomyces aberdarensis TaxID=2316362 RepID=A0A4Q2DDL6_9AGAR|nr:hypothetical protein EST38_g8844 [Candolleomyces aberdarensis]